LQYFLLKFLLVSEVSEYRSRYVAFMSSFLFCKEAFASACNYNIQMIMRDGDEMYDRDEMRKTQRLIDARDKRRDEE